MNKNRPWYIVIPFALISLLSCITIGIFFVTFVEWQFHRFDNSLTVIEKKPDRITFILDQKSKDRFRSSDAQTINDYREKQFNELFEKVNKLEERALRR